MQYAFLLFFTSTWEILILNFREIPIQAQVVTLKFAIKLFQNMCAVIFKKEYSFENRCTLLHKYLAIFFHPNLGACNFAEKFEIKLYQIHTRWFSKKGKLWFCNKESVQHAFFTFFYKNLGNFNSEFQGDPNLGASSHIEICDKTFAKYACSGFQKRVQLCIATRSSYKFFIS